MHGLLAVGGPRLDAYGNGSLDLGLVAVIIAILLIFRLGLGIRIGWQVLLAATLLAPLLSPLVHHIGIPQALALTYLGLLGARSLRSRRGPPPDLVESDPV